MKVFLLILTIVLLSGCASSTPSDFKIFESKKNEFIKNEESKSYIIESNGSLIEAYNDLDKNLEKLPSHDRERIIQEAIIKFLNSLK